MFNAIRRCWRRRRERFYWKSHWHLVLDLSLTLVIVILLAVIIGLWAYRPGLGDLFSPSQKPVVDLNNPPLQLNFTLGSLTAKPEAPMSVKINFKNAGERPVAKAKINIILSDNNFSLSQVELDAKTTASLNGQTLLLPPIAAGSSGEVAFKVYFSQLNKEARALNWQAQVEYMFSGQLLKQTVVLPTLQTAATLEVTASLFYNSPQGDQLGAGPLPPEVGLPTNYWVFWEAKSSGDFKDFVMSAKLPVSVELTGKRSLLAGTFNYNAVSRQLIWQVPTINEGGDNYRAGFEIQLVPTKSQVGRVLPLLTDTKYSTKDALSGELSEDELANPTTNLDADRINRGQGQVGE